MLATFRFPFLPFSLSYPLKILVQRLPLEDQEDGMLASRIRLYQYHLHLPVFGLFRKPATLLMFPCRLVMSIQRVRVSRLQTSILVTMSWMMQIWNLQ